MLEIAFDENDNNLFLGEECPVADGSALSACDWTGWRKEAATLVGRFCQVRVLIVRGMQAPDMFRLALALAVETYDESGMLETVVFKVASSRSAMGGYRPYAALTNAVRYVRDLYRTEDEREIKADFKRLGYLGIVCEENYADGSLRLYFDGGGTEKQILSAKGRNAAIALVGIMKMKAICKEEIFVEGLVGLKEVKNASYLPEPKDEDELIKQIVDFCEGE